MTIIKKKWNFFCQSGISMRILNKHSNDRLNKGRSKKMAQEFCTSRHGKRILNNDKQYLIKPILFMGILLFFFFMALPYSVYSAEQGNPPDIQYEDDNLSIEAEEVPLGDLLEGIRGKCDFEIIGFEERYDEIVSFSYNGLLEEGIKKLVGTLGEKDYIFEFENGLLARVIISYGDYELEGPSGPGSMVIKDENLVIVVVQNVAEGSQAQDTGMLIGDIILDYDGIPINSAKQLKEEVEKKADKEKITMTIIRDDESMPIVLKGGIIGVRVKTSLATGTEEDEGWDEEEEW